MADKKFKSLSEVKNETGIAFGFAGAPYLDIAVERANAGSRKVGIISAANLAAVRHFSGDVVVGVAPCGGSADLRTILSEVPKVSADAWVFHGLAEYAQLILTEICGPKDSPQQSHYGEMARQVSNELIELTGVASVLYVTCDIIKDEDSGENRFNIIPGLKKLILGNLYHKLYVTTQKDEDGNLIPSVQDNPDLALRFITNRIRVAAPEGSSAPAAASAGATSSGAPRRRRL